MKNNILKTIKTLPNEIIQHIGTYTDEYHKAQEANQLMMNFQLYKNVFELNGGNDWDIAPKILKRIGVQTNLLGIELMYLFYDSMYKWTEFIIERPLKASK